MSAEYTFKRWRILGVDTGDNPAGYEVRTTYKSEVAWMRDWIKDRYDWFVEEFKLL